MIDGATCNASVTSGCDNKPPTVTVGSLPFGVAVDKRTDTIYVVNANENTLSVINGKTCNATNTSGCSQTRQGAAGQHVPLFLLGRRSEPSHRHGSVTTGCDKQPPTVTVGNDTGPAGLAVNHSTDTIYVDNTADDAVSVINGATCNGNNTSGCGHRPRRVAVGRQYFGYVALDPSTDLAYATDYFDDAVSVINGATCTASNTSGCDQIPPTVAVAASPVGLAVAPGNHNVYVADNGDGPVRSSASRRPGPPAGSPQASITGRPRSSGNPRPTAGSRSSTTSSPHRPARHALA